MNDMLKALKQGLRERKARYQDITNKINPLQQERKLLEEQIKAIERVISLEENEVKPTIEPEERVPEGGIELEYQTLVADLIGKSPKDAYRQLAKTHFKDKAFREKDIRELANKEGLRVRDKLIANSYSRSILIELRQEGFLEKVDRGVFRVTEQDQLVSTKRGFGLLDTEQ